jgi:adenosine deaminase
MIEFIKGIPKAELHLHIEGSFEPELMFQIAKRNNVKIPYKSVEEVKAAYAFDNLQDFLDIYYAGAGALMVEQDFYDLTWAYLEKVHSENVVHTEIMFDPQTHTDRGISFGTVIIGISNALREAEAKFGMTTKLIMSFLRHLSEEEAFKTLEEAMPYKKLITAVGLDSSELGNPPSKFQQVFAKASAEGFLTVAHAGEEGPAEYVWEALDLLNVSRVDHGNNSLDDEILVQELVDRKMPLTVCPLSNLKLQVVKDLKKHPLRDMLQKGLLATINSDDPAYFGGYMNANYIEVAEALSLTKEEICKLTKNAFEASFLNENQKKDLIARVEDYCKENSF